MKNLFTDLLIFAALAFLFGMIAASGALAFHKITSFLN